MEELTLKACKELDLPILSKAPRTNILHLANELDANNEPKDYLRGPVRVFATWMRRTLARHFIVDATKRTCWKAVRKHLALATDRFWDPENLRNKLDKVPEPIDALLKQIEMNLDIVLNWIDAARLVCRIEAAHTTRNIGLATELLDEAEQKALACVEELGAPSPSPGAAPTTAPDTWDDVPAPTTALYTSDDVTPLPQGCWLTWEDGTEKIVVDTSSSSMSWELSDDANAVFVDHIKHPKRVVSCPEDPATKRQRTQIIFPRPDVRIFQSDDEIPQAWVDELARKERKQREEKLKLDFDSHGAIPQEDGEALALRDRKPKPNPRYFQDLASSSQLGTRTQPSTKAKVKSKVPSPYPSPYGQPVSNAGRAVCQRDSQGQGRIGSKANGGEQTLP